MTVRLQMLCHPATTAVRNASFPADEALDEAGLTQLAAGKFHMRPAGQAAVGPERRVRQMAEALGLGAVVSPALRECDFGRWAGCSLQDIEATDPSGLADWLQNPNCAPHGGESQVHVAARVTAWLDEQHTGRGRIVALTHASILRAAIVCVLQAPLLAAGRISVPPLTCVTLTSNGLRWTLESLVTPKSLDNDG